MIEVAADWPVQGKPRRVGVDNASEFHSQAFERGCDQHGITIDWRPPGRPHFGGVVERVIGTLMGLVHGVPGTTFSNVGQRGSYDSDKSACLTLEELERWFTRPELTNWPSGTHKGTKPERWRARSVEMRHIAGLGVDRPLDVDDGKHLISVSQTAPSKIA